MQKYIVFLFLLCTLCNSKDLRGSSVLEEEEEVQEINLENMGDIINNTNVFDTLVKYFFQYNMPSIVSYTDDDAECYFIGDRCIFELDGQEIIMEIDFDENKPEYTLIVSHGNKRRLIRSELCENFNRDIQILLKSIECEITEYAHVIKVKNI